MCFLFFSHPLFCPGEDFSAEAVPEIGGFILGSSRRADKQEGGVRNEKCKKKKNNNNKLIHKSKGHVINIQVAVWC